MWFGKREHFWLGSLKQITNFRHIRHASAGESGTKLICEDGFLLQQKTDVGEVVLIAAHHFRENEIERGRPENSQALKIQRKPHATGQPIGCDNPELRSWPVGSCDAPSQKGVGDAIVARWLNGFTEGVKKCDEGVAATLW